MALLELLADAFACPGFRAQAQDAAPELLRVVLAYTGAAPNSKGMPPLAARAACRLAEAHADAAWLVCQ